jgi:hypothetical protein
MVDKESPNDKNGVKIGHPLDDSSSQRPTVKIPPPAVRGGIGLKIGTKSATKVPVARPSGRIPVK